MNRKLIYITSLVVFFLMWGVFGIAAASPQNHSSLPATVPPVESTSIVSSPTGSAGIPITGRPEPVLTEILGFYGLIGVTALFLILGLLNVANKSTAPYVEHKSPPTDKTPNN